MKIFTHFLLTFIFLAGAVQPAQSQILSPDLFGLGGNRQKSEAPSVTIQLTPKTAQPGDEVTLSVRITLPPDGYTYSMKKGLGGSPTKIDIKTIVGLEPMSEFISDHKPVRKYEEIFKKNVEKYTEQVTWKRKYRILPNANLKTVAVKGMLRYQYCDARQCAIKNEIILLTLLDDGKIPSSQSTKKALETHPYSFKRIPIRGRKKRRDPLSLQFALSPENAKPGETVTLSITMQLDKDWHVYAQTQDPKNVGLPVKLNVKNLYRLEPTDGKFTPSRKPETKHIQPGNIEQKLFHNTVTWKQTFKVAKDAQQGKYGLRGQIRYQVCEKVCLPPRPLKFVLGIVKKGNLLSGAQSEEDNFKIKSQAGLSDEFQLLPPKGVKEVKGGVLYYLALAFIGGLFLNVMPCVLPVLAIKVLSFVKQAGESRGKILALNLSYSFGVITVFLILAGFAVSIGMGLGQQFQKPEFNIFMASFIFAMALSLLGVFEIPVLGLVNTAASGEQKEGMTGAFITGIFATLLATPCAGPFMGPILAWSAKQEPMVTFSVWTMLGIGMASPYLIFGLFPQAVKLLPKPGMWMVRFKEFSGFALMATVIYFVYILQKEFTLTVMLLLILLGISIGVWMIGNFYTQVTPLAQKNKIRATAFTITALLCFFGWYGNYRSRNGLELPWENFSTQKLQASRIKKKTILIDFTASWCPNCKVNEGIALNRKKTLDFVKKHNIETFKADFSGFSPEIKAWLKRFKSETIPLTVIIPANKPNTAIVFRTIFSEKALIENLNYAIELSKTPDSKIATKKQSTRE